MSYVYVLSDKKGLYYVGKSVNIKKRMESHKCVIEYKGNCSSRFLDIDFKCEILEEYSNEWDLLEGEQKWYDIYKKEHGDKLVNKCRPLNTQEEYRAEHSEQTKENWKNYYAEHTEELNKKAKQYRAEYSKEIKLQQTKKYVCECGGSYSQCHRSCHLKTKKHLNYTKVKPN